MSEMKKLLTSLLIAVTVFMFVSFGANSATIYADYNEECIEERCDNHELQELYDTYYEECHKERCAHGELRELSGENTRHDVLMLEAFKQRLGKEVVSFSEEGVDFSDPRIYRGEAATLGDYIEEAGRWFWSAGRDIGRACEGIVGQGNCYVNSPAIEFLAVEDDQPPPFDPTVTPVPPTPIPAPPLVPTPVPPTVEPPIVWDPPEISPPFVPNVPGCPSGNPVPIIMAFEASQAPEGSGASFALTWEVEGATQVEIFGHSVDPQSGTFLVWDDKPNYWILWAKFSGTPDECYTERGLYVTPLVAPSSN
jgi:hypothetical protein